MLTKEQLSRLEASGAVAVKASGKVGMGHGIPYTLKTADRWDSPRTSKGKAWAKKVVAKQRRQGGKREIDRQAQGEAQAFQYQDQSEYPNTWSDAVQHEQRYSDLLSLTEDKEEITFNEAAAISIAGLELAEAFADSPDLTEDDLFEYVMECLPQALAEAKHPLTKMANRLSHAAVDHASHGHAEKAHVAAAKAFRKAGDAKGAAHHDMMAHYHGQHAPLGRRIAKAAFGAVKSVAGRGASAAGRAALKGAGKVAKAIHHDITKPHQGAMRHQVGAEPSMVRAHQAAIKSKAAAVSKFVKAGVGTAKKIAGAAQKVGSHATNVAKGAVQGAVAAHKARKDPFRGLPVKHDIPRAHPAMAKIKSGSQVRHIQIPRLKREDVVAFDEMDAYLEGVLGTIAQRAKNIGKIAKGAVHGAVAGAKAAAAHTPPPPAKSHTSKSGWSVSAADLRKDPHHAIAKAQAAHGTVTTKSPPPEHTHSQQTATKVTKPPEHTGSHTATSAEGPTKAHRRPEEPGTKTKISPPPLEPALARQRALKKKANEETKDWLARLDELLSAA